MTDRFVAIISAAVILASLAAASAYRTGASSIMALVFMYEAYTLFAVFVLDLLLAVFWPTAAGILLVLSSFLIMVFDKGMDLIAEVLDHPKNDKVIRMIGVILFLIGFHFDLMGS
jgi:hypothetical protein